MSRRRTIDDTGVQVADVVVAFEHLLNEDAAAVQKRIDERFDSITLLGPH
jgi:hypothetical protein